MGLMDEVDNPNNVEVSTSDKYLSKDTARLLSRKTLMNQVRKHCDMFQNGKCNDCETEKEVNCLTAWKITIGKGKKLY